MVDIDALPRSTRESELTVRVPEELAADRDGFMGGWWCVRQAADVLTLLASHLDGDSALLRRYNWVDFLRPVYSGEYLRFTGRLTRLGTSSRWCEVEAHRVVAVGVGPQMDVVDPPEKVFGAEVVFVVPLDRQRNSIGEAG